MRVFAKNDVLAKVKFWSFLKRQRKIKRSSGEILAVSEIFERKTNNVKNFGIVVKYRSRSGIHNMYKEYRDVSLCGAVSQMYMEMSGRHRAVHDTIHIVKACTVDSQNLKRPKNIVYASNKARFPNVENVIRAPNKASRVKFQANRPNTSV